MAVSTIRKAASGDDTASPDLAPAPPAMRQSIVCGAGPPAGAGAT